MKTEITIRPEIRDIPMDALMDQPATQADWGNALHLTYGKIRPFRIAIDEVASRYYRLSCLPSSADWAQEPLAVADNMLSCALAIERTAIRSAVEIHKRYSCSVDDAIRPFIEIMESALIISRTASTQVKNFSYLPVDDEAACVTVGHFVNIAETATCIAETACADIAALRKGVKRVRWLTHLNYSTPPFLLDSWIG